MNIPVNIITVAGGKMPVYKTPGSACADCFARVNEKIKPGETKIIPLGFKVEIPSGYEMQIRGRSGLASKGVKCSLGTVDSDYRGEVGAIISNFSDNDFEINAGDRIAQCTVFPVYLIQFCLVDELSATKRGAGGFGSTGIKEIEKFYEPFSTVREVPLDWLGKLVIVDKSVKMFFKRAWLDRNGFLVFQFGETTSSPTIELNTSSAFQRVTIEGHRFGKEIKEDGNS